MRERCRRACRACRQPRFGGPGARAPPCGCRALPGAALSTLAASGAFVAGAAVSLSAAWVLVARLERLGNRFGVSDALLGLISALAADAPEITSAVSALAGHHGAVGAGVVVGSNVFNLAALIGLGAVVAGGIRLRRRAVLLEGAIASWVAVTCVLMVVGVVPAPAALALAAVVLVPYVVLAAVAHSRWWQRPHASHARRWLRRALSDEELEVGATLRAPRGRPLDAVVAVAMLAVVVVASIAMERGAIDIGKHFHVSGIIVGGVVLAAVTSLPNAVAAIYWARRGRGNATLSTALNSNALNVAAGLFLPAVLVGLGRLSSTEVLAAAWYAGLTVLVLFVAYRSRGVGRLAGSSIVALYLVYVVVLASTS